MKKILLLALALLLPVSGFAAEACMYYFWQPRCAHCATTEPILEDLQNEYSDLNIVKFNIQNASSYNLLMNLSAQYGFAPRTTPIIFIGGEVIEYSQNIREVLENKTVYYSEKGCGCPGDNVCMDGITPLTLGALLAGAFLDSINPCEFAVLIILISTILTRGDKKKALKAGLAFASAIFLMYFIMGFGLFSAIHVLNVSGIIFKAVGILAIIIGLLNIKDYFWYGKGLLMEVPMSWRPYMKRIIKATTSPKGAFFTGLIVSLFLTPCTSGPYVVIIGMLSNRATMLQAVPLLILYNAIFIAPMVFLTIMFTKGYSTERAERIRQKNLRLLHLIAGVLMLGLGALMVSGII
jgi:cytochrome c biogenesis protein CcdA